MQSPGKIYYLIRVFLDFSCLKMGSILYKYYEFYTINITRFSLPLIGKVIQKLCLFMNNHLINEGWECMAKIYAPTRVIQGTKVIPVAQMKQADYQAGAMLEVDNDLVTM